MLLILYILKLMRLRNWRHQTKTNFNFRNFQRSLKNIDVIAVTETKKKVFLANILLLNSFSFGCTLTKSSTGDALFYFDSHLSYKFLHDLNFYKLCELEYAFIQVFNFRKRCYKEYLQAPLFTLINWIIAFKINSIFSNIFSFSFNIQFAWSLIISELDFLEGFWRTKITVFTGKIQYQFTKI